MNDEWSSSPWAATKDSQRKLTDEEALMEWIDRNKNTKPIHAAIQRGVDRLESGEVTPSDAQKHVKALAKVLPKVAQKTDENPAGAAPQPTVVTGEAPAAADAPTVMGKPLGSPGTVARDTTTTQSKGLQNTTRNLLASDDEIEAMRHRAMGDKPRFGEKYRVPAPTATDPLAMVDKQDQVGWDQDPTDPYRQQEQGTQAMQGILSEMLKQPTPTDYGPLADLATAWGSGKYKSTYKAPPSQTKLILDYADDLQKRKADMSKTVLDSMKSQKMGTTQDLLQTLLTSQAMREAGDPNRYKKGGSDVQLRLKEKEIGDNIQKSMEPLSARSEQLAILNDALATNDYQKVQSTLSIVAKNIGTDAGMLSNQDIARTMPRTVGSDWASFEAYFTNNPSAQMDPKIAKGLRELAAIAMKRAAERYGKTIDMRRNEYKTRASYKDVNVDALFEPYRNYVKTFGEAAKKWQTDAAKAGGATGGAGKIKVTSPDGKSGFVPASQLDAALKQGYKKAE